ncbi:MAG: septum formation initiator family protein [Candidatus Magasanikbacteria bacterium]|nr:septum formation initiator family protein [Candidatus Magasanikbacteria bacterium]MCA9391336.1 septum formation initiator family protein [Candidatus Magasanikbacteria bacterium]HPF95321.1 septum formation initiator family protein [bacterium]
MESKNLKSQAKNTKRWSLFVIVSLFLFFLVSVSSVRQTYSEWKFDQELKRMQNEIEQLEGRKLELAELLNRLDSPDALDKEARTRLGLKKPGERVIILRGFDGASSTWTDQGVMMAPAPSSTTETRSNPVLWFDYFF